ncbi:hypothetical protein H0H87_003944 [Tephrocybe sp. NHM501043]|nr:hypothetical protein H0H87_003944 [Tephrocybe sp. NHM501043]
MLELSIARCISSTPFTTLALGRLEHNHPEARGALPLAAPAQHHPLPDVQDRHDRDNGAELFRAGALDSRNPSIRGPKYDRFVTRFPGINSISVEPVTDHSSEPSNGEIDLDGASPSLKSPGPSPTVIGINSDPIGLLHRTAQRPTTAQRTALQRILSHKVEESSQVDSDLQLVQLELEELQMKKDDLEQATLAFEAAAKACRSILSSSTSDKLMKKLEELELATSARESKLHAFRATLLSARMSELRNKKTILERAHPKKAADVVAYLCILSSSRLLPREVLSTIFHYATQRNHETHARSHSPVALSHVCFAWREAALGTSTLWNNLEIEPSLYRRAPYVAQSGYSPITARMSAWATRADTIAPLSVALKIDAKGLTEILQRKTGATRVSLCLKKRQVYGALDWEYKEAISNNISGLHFLGVN